MSTMEVERAQGLLSTDEFYSLQTDLPTLFSYRRKSEIETRRKLYADAASGLLGITALTEIDLAAVQVSYHSLLCFVNSHHSELGLASYPVTQNIPRLSDLPVSDDPSQMRCYIPEDNSFPMLQWHEPVRGDHTLAELVSNSIVQYADGADEATTLERLKGAFCGGSLRPADPDSVVDMSQLRPGGRRFFADASALQTTGELFATYLRLHRPSDYHVR